ncbi:MAG: hypothetical protein JWQ71_1310 [Pedosphaera sp.]|nr:hypothetical protein [Pedosphaera sp.]
MKLSQFIGLTATAFVLMTGAAFGQTPATNRPARTVQVNPRPRQPAPDLFDSLVASAASFDTDSPVEARAEFDPPTVPMGGRAIYRVVITALNESVKLPDQMPSIPGIELRSGGRGQAYQPTGAGKLRPETTIIFRATTTATGSFTMPAFTMMAYSKPVKVPEARLTVVPATVTGTQQPPHLLLELPEGDIYVGQTLRVPLMLPDPADGTVHGLTQPRITGDFVFSEPFPIGGRHEAIRRNGKIFPVFIQEVMLTPLREGQQELVGQAQSISTRALPGQTNVFQSYSALVDSEPVIMTAKLLPKEGQLPSFTGGIGTFQLELPKVSTNEVRAGEPLTLTVTVRGDGNIGRVVLPQIPFSREWQTFPAINDGAPPSIVQQRGFAAFSYTLIPLSEKIQATPAIPFSYFDSQKKVYMDLTIPPVPLTVKPGPIGALAQTKLSSASTSSENDDPANQERELVMTGLLEKPGHAVSSLIPVQRHWWFLGFQSLPAAGIVGLWAWDRRRRFLENHPEVILKRRARRELHRQLQRARRAAVAQDVAGFVSGAINALREACAPHGAANPEALVCADVLEVLPVSEREGQSGVVVRRLFNAADAMRFGGPIKDGPDLIALKPELERLLNQLKAKL